MTTREAQTRGKRVTALFRRCGEAIVLARGGANQTVRGVCAPMDGNTVNAFFDGNESVGLVRPALTLYADGREADPPLSGDVFFRDGRLWTVRKTQAFRAGDALLLWEVLCD